MIWGLRILTYLDDSMAVSQHSSTAAQLQCVGEALELHLWPWLNPRATWTLCDCWHQATPTKDTRSRFG